MTRDPFYRRLGGPQGRSEQLRKILPPPGFDPRTVQSVGSRRTQFKPCIYTTKVFQGPRYEVRETEWQQLQQMSYLYMCVADDTLPDYI